jgi:hypothetical protein
MYDFVPGYPGAVVLLETTQDYPVLWDHGTAEHERRISGRPQGADTSPLGPRDGLLKERPQPVHGPKIDHFAGLKAFGACS